MEPIKEERHRLSVDLRPDFDETRLVRCALAGDERALALLFRMHHATAMRVAGSYLKESPDAEDVVQESFLKAWRAMDRFDPDSPFGPWIRTIVANEARTRIRSNRRRVEAHGRFETHTRQFQEPDPSVETLVLANEVRSDIDRALAELRPKDEEVLRLRYDLDLDESEMAHRLDVPSGTVKSRLSRALSRLRDHVVLVLVGVLSISCVVAVAVPPVRAEIERILGLTGATEVISVPELPERLSTRPFDWGPVVDIERIGELNPFGAEVPRFEGMAPEVRLRQDLDRPLLTFEYGGDTATIVQGQGPLMLAKLVPVGAQVRRVRADGGEGLWIPGGLNHALAALDPRGGYVPGPATRVDAGVLAFRGPDGRDYRIQTRRGLKRALELARTLYSRADRP